MTQSARRYDQLVNLKSYQVDIGQGQELAHYRDLFSKNGRQIVKETVKDNFRDVTMAKAFSDLNVKSLIKETVLGVNVKNAAWPAARGLVFGTLAKMGGIGLATWSVLAKTRESYSQNQSAWSAAKTFCTEAFKSIVSWEAGSIAYVFGVANLPVGVLAPIAAIGCMGLASVGTKAVLDEIA